MSSYYCLRCAQYFFSNSFIEMFFFFGIILSNIVFDYIKNMLQASISQVITCCYQYAL